MSTFAFRGPDVPRVPLLVTVPHAGTEAPPELEARWTTAARRRPDTDWHLGMLYDFVPELGAQMMVARYSRYVVDLNRPPGGQKLYGSERRETGLIPLTTFDDQPIYLPGEEPGDAERAERVVRYWRPWHDAIRQRLDAIRERFGYAILFDAHSIPSVVPRFFPGTLPELLIGTVDGASSAPELPAAVQAVFAESPFHWTLNHIFRGGYITRSFGAPQENIHAIQLEMSQRIYMDEAAPFVYHAERAGVLKPWLRRALAALAEAVPGGSV